MASRPKSPGPPSARSDKEESFWDKIGTLGRKKRIKEGTTINYTALGHSHTFQQSFLIRLLSK